MLFIYILACQGGFFAANSRVLIKDYKLAVQKQNPKLKQNLRLIKFRRLIGLIKTSALASVLALSACQQQPAATNQEVENPAAAIKSPAVWVVSDADSRLYLIGTVPLVKQDAVWQTLAVRGAIDDSKAFLIETDPSNSSAVAAMEVTRELGFYTDGSRLTDLLDAVDTEKLARVSARANIPLGTLENIKPWLASSLLAIAAGENAGLSTENPIIENAIDTAKIKQSPVMFLSTADSQVRDLGELPADVQLSFLKRTLDDYDGLGTGMIKTAEEWQVGGLLHLKTESTNVLSQLPSSEYRTLIKKRNDAWIGTIDEFLKGSDNGVLIVGMAHLIDSGNLQVMLIERGYTVRQYYGID